MVIAVTTPKGGAGKTTVAINLAVALAHKDYSVCIIDADEGQFSATQWASYRDDLQKHIPVYKVSQERLNREVKGLERNFDIILIDGRPTQSSTADRIVLASDIVIIPVMPSLFDLAAFEEFLPRFKEVQEVKKDFGGQVSGYVLLNGLIVNTKIGDEIESAVKSIVNNSDVAHFLDAKIMRRVVYGNSPTNGLGVIEDNDKKAVKEMNALCTEIERIIQKSTD